MITSPGKFEGEPVFAPYFYKKALQGLADEDDGDRWTFDITDADCEMWPELVAQGWAPGGVLIMRTDDNGFVHCRDGFGCDLCGGSSKPD